MSDKFITNPNVKILMLKARLAQQIIMNWKTSQLN